MVRSPGAGLPGMAGPGLARARPLYTRRARPDKIDRETNYVRCRGAKRGRSPDGVGAGRRRLRHRGTMEAPGAVRWLRAREVGVLGVTGCCPLRGAAGASTGEMVERRSAARRAPLRTAPGASRGVRGAAACRPGSRRSPGRAREERRRLELAEGSAAGAGLRAAPSVPRPDPRGRSGGSVRAGRVGRAPVFPPTREMRQPTAAPEHTLPPLRPAPPTAFVKVQEVSGVTRRPGQREPASRGRGTPAASAQRANLGSERSGSR